MGNLSSKARGRAGRDADGVPDARGARERRGASEFPRGPGLLVLTGLVVLGIGATSAFLIWQAPKAKERFERSLAQEPSTAEGRLVRWMDFGGPIIDSRLKQLRLSRQQPWLVTHVVEPERAGEAPDVWGIDLTELDPGIVTRAGMVVTVRLPEPRCLLSTHLVGTNADRVPRVALGETPPDPRERTRYLAHFMLGPTIAALEKDIPGAQLLIEVGGERSDGDAAGDSAGAGAGAGASGAGAAGAGADGDGDDGDGDGDGEGADG